MIELPDEVAATLAERAKAAGLSTAEAFLAATPSKLRRFFVT
jgi:hypothetical protein